MTPFLLLIFVQQPTPGSTESSTVRRFTPSVNRLFAGTSATDSLLRIERSVLLTSTNASQSVSSVDDLSFDYSSEDDDDCLTHDHRRGQPGPATGKTYASKVSILSCRLLTAQTCCKDRVDNSNRHCPCLSLLDPWAMQDERARVYMNKDKDTGESVQASRKEVRSTSTKYILRYYIFVQAITFS